MTEEDTTLVDVREHARKYHMAKAELADVKADFLKSILAASEGGHSQESIAEACTFPEHKWTFHRTRIQQFLIAARRALVAGHS